MKNVKPFQEKELAQCPFWRDTAGRHQICCEGITPHSIIVQEFRLLHEMRQQRRIFCCRHYKNCELFRAIMEAKYAGELE